MKNGPYELVVAPPEYPGKKYRGRYVYQHRLVWWQQTGEVLPSYVVVHHKNEKKRDNAFTNLESKGVKAHVADHHKPAAITQTRCAQCGSTFEINVRAFKTRSKASSKLYCGRSCQVTAQQAQRAKERKTGSESSHGTPRRYRFGCRCELCRKANAERCRKYK